MYAAGRHGTLTLMFLPKEQEVSCEDRPPQSPFRSLTSLDRAQFQSPGENCISRSATSPVNLGVVFCNLQMNREALFGNHLPSKTDVVLQISN